MPMGISHRLAVLATSVASILVAACSHPTSPGLDPSCVAAIGFPVAGRPVIGTTAMQVTGQGSYTRRFSAELAVHGNTAYMSTWSTREDRRAHV